MRVQASLNIRCGRVSQRTSVDMRAIAHTARRDFDTCNAMPESCCVPASLQRNDGWLHSAGAPVRVR